MRIFSALTFLATCALAFTKQISLKSSLKCYSNNYATGTCDSISFQFKIDRRNDLKILKKKLSIFFYFIFKIKIFIFYYLF